MNMKIIIFDFDGTLGDTQSVIFKSFKEAVVKAGYEEPTEEADVPVEENTEKEDK